MSAKQQKHPKSTGTFPDLKTDHVNVNDGLVPDNIADLEADSTAQQLKTDAIKKATEPLESRTAKSANKVK